MPASEGIHAVEGRKLLIMKSLAFVLALFMLASCVQRETKDITRYTIEQLSGNIVIYGGGAFSDDESSLLLSNNETGIFNVYELTIADGTMRQVTHSGEESFMAIAYVPGTGQILYSADKGGNEIDHIYLLP